MTLKRQKIAALLKETPGQEVLAKGWVRTKRGNKNITFIALNDGSTINNIQIRRFDHQQHTDCMRHGDFHPR